ncbi:MULTISPECIES: hypothetical protein [unclassified Oceanispirochaeta]|uniref:hypothetical protein n=1 Tax=unclassified Oceanispirochaeta TaxID=2635722 RepID=UPI0011C078BB|nr:MULTISPECIES: hypothetical protein [unclassified Oceanispirochaeta]MBF9017070.1 hypothetical protein [Oceanispirochaeta sp. M2]NPD73519.1 hypothetical protein [Oceanispirochaeta sp. M1]
MNINCPHCKSLNLAALLEGGDALSTKGISEKLIRFYCNSPKTLNDYCPYAGKKEDCRHISI